MLVELFFLFSRVRLAGHRQETARRRFVDVHRRRDHQLPSATSRHVTRGVHGSKISHGMGMGIKCMGMGVKTCELSPATVNSLLFLHSNME